MSPNSTAKKVIAEVEGLTGCPVEVRQDASIKQMAVLEMARGPTRVHRIRIHPNFQDEADYLICFECGFILRKYAVPPDARMDFAVNPNGRREVQEMVFEHNARKGMPADVIRGLAEQLFQGLRFQLISIPSSMRVDTWVAETFPELADRQATMVKHQLQPAWSEYGLTLTRSSRETQSSSQGQHLRRQYRSPPSRPIRSDVASRHPSGSSSRRGRLPDEASAPPAKTWRPRRLCGRGIRRRGLIASQAGRRGFESLRPLLTHPTRPRSGESPLGALFLGSRPEALLGLKKGD